jgi:predicted transcriptional regulator
VQKRENMPVGEVLNLNDEQNRRFDALAQKAHKSKGALIHQALEEFLDRNVAKPKSAEQIRNERDAGLIQLMRVAAKKHGVATADVRKDFGTLNTAKLMERYKLPIETIKEIQRYIGGTETANK